MFGLEAVVLVADPDGDLALQELGVGRGALHAQHVAGGMQLAQVVGAGLHVVHAAAIGVGRGKGQHLADAGGARVQVDHGVLELGLEQVGPAGGHVLHQLLVHQEGDVERVDGEPAALGLAEHGWQLVEVDGLEGGDHVLLRRIHRRRGKVIGGVGLRAAAGLLQCHHGGGRADVVVGQLDLGVALLEVAEQRLPVGPLGPGVERDAQTFLLRLGIQGLLARIELGAVKGKGGACGKRCE